ncbi:uncharacterized mitochondrial protein AtMg00240-like [Primulina eburnea]|uniref:uncharacterized mitochondrial protein AtMg00240-like n=1 Tax=Primulina eburnea TaxID=1245227 RepID=UPI003C6BDA97
MEQNLRLTTKEFGDSKSKGDSSDVLMQDPSPYRRLVGRFIYLTVTRPYICFAEQTLSQFMQAPKESHMDATMRVLWYLKSSPGLGLLLSTQSSFSLVVYCDSEWATCPMSRRSITGYHIKLGNSLISWKTKKPRTMSRLSVEAECR